MANCFFMNVTMCSNVTVISMSMKQCYMCIHFVCLVVRRLGSLFLYNICNICSVCCFASLIGELGWLENRTAAVNATKVINISTFTY